MTTSGIRNLLFIASFVMLDGCASTGVSFDPDIHLGDYQKTAIVGEHGDVVLASSPDFNHWGCMIDNKWVELRDILRHAHVSPSKIAELTGNVEDGINSEKNYNEMDRQFTHLIFRFLVNRP